MADKEVLTTEEFIKRAAREHGWDWPLFPGPKPTEGLLTVTQEKPKSLEEEEQVLIHVSYDMTQKIIVDDNTPS